VSQISATVTTDGHQITDERATPLKLSSNLRHAIVMRFKLSRNGRWIQSNARLRCVLIGDAHLRVLDYNDAILDMWVLRISVLPR
jgi:post-segregation antitoxin (ccd killing protein)